MVTGNSRWRNLGIAAATPSARRAERRTRTFERIDQDGSGQVERGEWDGYANRRFARMDADENGEVSFGEFVAYVK